jgi:hypothetical protein
MTCQRQTDVLRAPRCALPDRELLSAGMVMQLTSVCRRVHESIDIMDKIQFLSQRKRYVSMRKTDRLTLFRDMFGVYCENMKHTNTLCGQNAEFLNVEAQRLLYVPPT